MTSHAPAGNEPKYAIVRLSTFDDSKLAQSPADYAQFQRRHAALPGYAGSISVDLGAGRRLAVNLWRSEEDGDSARESLRDTIAALLGDALTGSQLIGAGPIAEIDLGDAPQGSGPPPTGTRPDPRDAGPSQGTAPAAMRAVVFRSPGPPEVITVIDLPVPEPGDRQVRVKVQAAPVFSADVAARSGAMGPMLRPRPYHVLGWDMAGTVDAVGAGVSGFAPGDAVIGMSNPMSSRAGTQAEYVVVDVSALATSPKGVDPVAASTIPANGLTALQALEALGLRSGDSLAITGAAGAVGGYAAELGHQRGLRVLGVANPSDEAFIATLGAEFVPKSSNPVESIRRRVPRGVDGLIDAAAVGSVAIGAVRDGGTLIPLIAPAAPAPERGVRVLQFMVHADAGQLRDLVALAEHGRLTMRVARTFRFEEVAQAHAIFESGGVRGRLVVVR